MYDLCLSNFFRKQPTETSKTNGGLQILFLKNMSDLEKKIFCANCFSISKLELLVEYYNKFFIWNTNKKLSKL